MAHNFQLSDPALLFKGGWINGQSYTASSGQDFAVDDPSTGREWRRETEMDAGDTQLAIKAANDAFPAFSALSARERAKLLMNLHNEFEKAKDDLAMIMVMEAGKPFSEAKGEVDFCADCSWFTIGECERLQGEAIKGLDNPNMRYLTVREPIGPVGLMCAWNFPLELAYRKMISALATGCTAVLKPSPETPFSTAALGLLVKRAGYADGVVNIVTASERTTPEVGKAMCEDSRLKKISFTGSTGVGRLIAQLCAPQLKKVTLELGGNGAWVIFDDADLDKCADRLVANKFRNAGQVCVAANRVFVQSGVLERFSKLVQEQVSRLRLGHGLDPDTTIGPLATSRAAERCVELVKDAEQHGGTVVVGGKKVGDGFHFEPTLLVGVNSDALVHQNEIFAPICPLYSFDTEEEVVQQVNNTDLGLTHYVWTQNLSRALRCFDKFKAGQVAINSGSASSVEVPFGGIKDSGLGKEGGYKYGLEDYCVVRVAAIQITP